MQVKSRDGRIIALRGRIGDFIFRTFKSGKIFATYAPSHNRTNHLPLSYLLRKQMKDLNLEIVND